MALDDGVAILVSADEQHQYVGSIPTAKAGALPPAAPFLLTYAM